MDDMLVILSYIYTIIEGQVDPKKAQELGGLFGEGATKYVDSLDKTNTAFPFREVRSYPSS